MHSVGMRINKKLLATIAVPVLLGGWALFRPELIFVNKTVDEKLPVSATSTQTLSQLAVGSFTSQAHETKGTAEIVRIGDKTYLQLKDFSTSNGPDVRVYLTSGGNPGKESLSLGSLKGNIGTQNYELPKTYDPTTHQAVSIWCERFAVGFGLAAHAARCSHCGNFLQRLRLTLKAATAKPTANQDSLDRLRAQIQELEAKG